MSERVKVETHTSESTFRSSGGFETAVKVFLVKFPDNSAGTVTIRKDTRTWYKSGDDVVINKRPEDAGYLTFNFPVCPDCGSYLDKDSEKCLCPVCGLTINITKKGNRYSTTVNET